MNNIVNALQTVNFPILVIPLGAERIEGREARNGSYTILSKEQHGGSCQKQTNFYSS